MVRRWPFLLILALLSSLMTGVVRAQTGWIVFSSTLEGSFDVFAIEPDGTDRVNLTHSPHQEWDPTLSPAGTQIAFSRRTQGSNFSDTWVMAADGTAQERLTLDPATYDRDPAWSPDGDWLAWTRSRGSTQISQIWTMRSNGTGKTPLTDVRPGIYDHSPAWSPDGQRIAFVSNRGRRFTDIWVMGEGGGNPHRLTRTRGKIEGHPAWSPDGTSIAYECRTPDQPIGICVMDADGGGPSSLVDSEGYEAQPSWAPDGSSLVYTHVPPTGGDKDLVVSATDGSARSTLTSSPRIDFEASWGVISGIGNGSLSMGTSVFTPESASPSGNQEAPVVTRKVTKIAPGVKFLRMRYEDSNVFLVRFKPDFKPTLDVALGGQTLAGRQRVTSMAKANGAIVGMNADFPLPSGAPVHPFAQDGDLKSTSFRFADNFAMAADEEEAFVDLAVELLQTREVGNGDVWNFERWNHGAPTAAEIAAFSPPGGAEERPPKFACSARLTPAGGRRWAPLQQGVVRPFELDAARCSVARMGRLGGLVLSAQPATDGAFLLETLRPGEELAVTWFFRGWSGVADSVGGFPVLVEDGNVTQNCPSALCQRHPRTGIGITAGNVALLVVVDGRSPKSAGLTIRQFGQLFKQLGATDAVNLDGGGSSTMVVRGKIRNEPSDGTERHVCCAVLILPGKDGQEQIGPEATSPTTAPSSSETSREEWRSLVDPGSTGGMLDAVARGAFGADPSTLTGEMWSAVRFYREAS
jgi:Tol biopolymer transport system component